MDPTLITALVVAAAGITTYIYGEVQLRKAKKLNERTRELAAETEKVAAEALRVTLGKLFAPPTSQYVMPIATESISVAEAINVFKAAGIPTPGCGCEECDALRLARAAKQAGK